MELFVYTPLDTGQIVDKSETIASLKMIGIICCESSSTCAASLDGVNVCQDMIEYASLYQCE